MPHEGREVEAPLEHYDTTLEPLPLSQDDYNRLASLGRGDPINMRFAADPNKEKIFFYNGRKETLSDGSMLLHGVLEGQNRVNAALSFQADNIHQCA